MANNAKVFMMMAGLTALLVALGGYFGGNGGMTTALMLAGAMNFAMYFFSSSLVMKMYRARVVTAADAPELYGVVDELRQRAGLPMPKVGIAPHAQANAFATGRDPEHAVVCVTEGLLGMLSRDELEGVIAHELAHIKNRDMLLQTFTATLAGAISFLPRMAYFGSRDDDHHPNAAVAIVLMILAPIAAMLVQMAISRQREFKADAVGAEISGKPLALASALRRLEATARAAPMDVAPAAAPLAQVNPLSGQAASGILRLFLTHPPTEERVEALELIARSAAA